MAPTSGSARPSAYKMLQGSLRPEGHGIQSLPIRRTLALDALLKEYEDNEALLANRLAGRGQIKCFHLLFFSE